MGLLNDANNRKKLSTMIVVHHRKAIVLTFLAGIFWFLALTIEHNKTYFSENALLAGLVVREFTPRSSYPQALGILKEETKNHDSMPYAWIQAQFKQIGLDVYSQNFTLHYPFGSKPEYRGKNIYAVLRAPKSCSIESLVLSTPYRGQDSINEPTHPSIILMIELARHFRQHGYWSKDIIFLITEHEMVGFQAWLDAYHNVQSSKFIESGSLSSTSGLIQGVINLEIGYEVFNALEVKIEGLNGQLPNLDLFNLVIELCSRESVTPLFQGYKTLMPTFFLPSWIQNMKTMFSMMAIQSTGLPTGAHGLFQRYGIQALTLVSRKGSSKGQSNINLHHAGRVLEGVFRSLNNLLEKFHQSFFFYLLVSCRRYVSIGLYMPPLALIAAPTLIKALYLYIDSKTSIQKKEDLIVTSGFSLWSALDILISSHTLGFLVYICPNFIDILHDQGFTTEESLYYLQASIFVLAVLFIFVHSKFHPISQRLYSIKLCVVLLELGAFLYTLSLINISQATILALLFVPVSISLGCNHRLSVLRYIFLLLCNPFVLTFLIVLGQSYLTYPDTRFLQHLSHSFDGHKKLILYTVEDMHFFSNWNYKIVTLALVPIWFELWTLSTLKCI